MPNTRSAERRMRNSKRKRLHNRSIKSRLKSLERAYEEAVQGGLSRRLHKRCSRRRKEAEGRASTFSASSRRRLQTLASSNFMANTAAKRLSNPLRLRRVNPL